MPAPLAFLSGRIVPLAEARLSLLDAGLVWGAAIVERCRTWGGQLFRFADHLARFRAGCDAARIPLMIDDAELAAIAERLVAGDDDASLVILATPETLCLHPAPIPFARYRPFFTEGARLVVPPTRHVPAACLDPHIKHRSRLHWWIAEQQATDIDPACHALLQDVDGFLTETAFANLLLVKDGRVTTPWRGRVLPGIALRVVEEICRESGIVFDESDLTLADAREAEEALLTCSTFGVAPVSLLHRKPLRFPGEIYERLQAAWNARVGVDARGQFLNRLADIE